MASGSGFVFDDSCRLGSKSGPICELLECSDATIRELASPTRLSGSGCLLPRLEVVESIPIPTVLANTTLFSEDQPRQNGDNSGDPVLADSTLVSNGDGNVVRLSTTTSPDSESVDRLDRELTPTVEKRVILPNRLEVIRNSFGLRGFPENVSELLLDGERRSTSSAYESAWRCWIRWCKQRDIDPLSVALSDVLAYLTHLHESGKAYRTINVHRSMLSSMLPQIDGDDVGKHRYVCKLLKGIYNRNPPQSKYSYFWDIKLALERVKSWGNNDQLSFKMLTLKTIFLLAIATLFRVSELANISRHRITFEDDQVSFSLLRPRKTQHGQSLARISINSWKDDDILCPVRCLNTYVSKASELSTPYAESHSSLFRALKRPHCEVGSSTIARWLKQALASVGVDISRFSAHSTRGSAASNALANGTPVDEILKAANWSNAKTFHRFYHRPRK